MLIENSGGSQTVLATAKAEYDGTFEKQIAKGIEKYGVVLTTFNGRDAGNDAIEELVDLSVYLTQLRMEHQAYREILACVILEQEYTGTIPQKVWESIFKPLVDNDVYVVDLKRKWGL